MTGAITVNGGGGPEAPTVSTGAGTPTSDTEATLQGTVDPNGLATEYFFNYGTTTGYGQATSKKPAGAGTSAVAASDTVTGLSPGTTYHFQLVAENSSGTTLGADRTFTTLGPPLAITGSAAGVGATAATLQGSVNPRGHATTYFFEYGTTIAYGQETSAKSAGQGTSNVAVSASLSGLSPETTYHFRLVAENSSGDVSGADQTFTTSSSQPPPPPVEEPPPVIAPPPPLGEPPLASEGSPLGSAVAVVARRRGASVRVSVRVLPSGNGGRLQVVLRMKGRRSKRAIAGRLVRRGVSSGRQSFPVRLNARAKRILRRKHRLALKVQVKLVPVSGDPAVLTRSVVLRA